MSKDYKPTGDSGEYVGPSKLTSKQQNNDSNTNPNPFFL
jgi:hypothetical protein